MNFTRDLHLCGTCKKIFTDLDFFLAHKSQCSSPLNNVVLTTNTQSISSENGLFSKESVIDLTVIDSGSFLPVLHCESEEVVCEVTFQPQDKNVAALLAHQSTTEIAEESNIISKNENHEVEKKQRKENTSDNTVKIKRHKCDFCKFASNNHMALVRHVRIHTGEKPYRCPECDKRFARPDKLISHRRIHIGDKRYKCQLCEYASVDRQALKRHILIHTDERPYKCQMCPYRARYASHMVTHLRIHTGDSPFFCKFNKCGMTFKTSQCLKRHIKLRHMKKKEKTDSLLASNSSFNDETDKSSIMHVHTNGKLSRKSPSCHLCQDLTRRDVVKKVRRARGLGKKSGAPTQFERTHKCSLCPASFVRPDSLQSHLNVHLTAQVIQDNVQPQGNKSLKPSSYVLPQIVESDPAMPNSQPKDETNKDFSFVQQ